MYNKNIEKIINKMSVEQLVGQTMCVGIPSKSSDKQIERLWKDMHIGGLFLVGRSPETIKKYIDLAQKASDIPLIVASDIEHGAGNGIIGEPVFPNSMAWGACNDAELMEKAGELTAKICRLYGINYNFGPIIDLNLNHDNPESNIRSISDDPDRVIKIGGAFYRGLTKNGYMVTACKHFPGQGTDDRNSHFVTTINGLSKAKWYKTFGKIYKEFIKMGTASIMVGHSCLPAFDSEKDQLFGEKPAVLSKALMTDLLKGKLKFKGCIVSDAMGMIGVSARVPLDKMAIEFYKAGGDMYLFPGKMDYEQVVKAVRSGEIPLERMKDAVRRVLYMKEKARLFEDEDKVLSEISVDREEHKILAQQIADKSIKVLRNFDNVIPANLKKGSKILMLNMVERFYHEEPLGTEFSAMRKAFEDRGYQVTEEFKPTYEYVKENVDKYDMVLLNCKMSSRDYHGGSLRVAWDNIMVLWHARVLQHKRVIFTSFGCPYKIYEFPYLKEYINAFSYTDESQQAVVKVILGEIQAKGKNPVTFKPYFEIEE